MCNFDNFDAKSWVNPFGKIEIFPHFNFSQIGQENVCDDILERKNLV